MADTLSSQMYRATARSDRPLDPDAVTLLAERFRAGGDTHGLNHLAQRRDLTGTARDTLIRHDSADATVRVTLLLRNDLTDTELATLTDTNAAVLTTVAQNTTNPRTLAVIADNVIGARGLRRQLLSALLANHATPADATAALLAHRCGTPESAIDHATYATRGEHGVETQPQVLTAAVDPDAVIAATGNHTSEAAVATWFDRHGGPAAAANALIERDDTDLSGAITASIAASVAFGHTTNTALDDIAAFLDALDTTCDDASLDYALGRLRGLLDTATEPRAPRPYHVDTVGADNLAERAETTTDAAEIDRILATIEHAWCDENRLAQALARNPGVDNARAARAAHWIDHDGVAALLTETTNPARAAAIVAGSAYELDEITASAADIGDIFDALAAADTLDVTHWAALLRRHDTPARLIDAAPINALRDGVSATTLAHIDTAIDGEWDIFDTLVSDTNDNVTVGYTLEMTNLIAHTGSTTNASGVDAGTLTDDAATSSDHPEALTA